MNRSTYIGVHRDLHKALPRISGSDRLFDTPHPNLSVRRENNPINWQWKDNTKNRAYMRPYIRRVFALHI
ncbi:MAG: hypothetical protein KAR83_07535 [Thermodesulfovibrionales bacterium]|nr:hypothetical protein [Thermodesulfovibrionales bacterium]